MQKGIKEQIHIFNDAIQAQMENQRQWKKRDGKKTSASDLDFG